MEEKYIIKDISGNDHWYDIVSSMISEQVVYHKELASPDPDMFGDMYDVKSEYMKCVDDAEDFACLVAYRKEAAEKPIGFATLFEFDEHPVYPYTGGYIFDVHVEESERGAGLGHILMNAAMEWFATHDNMRTVTLEAWAGNERVMNLYRQYGFEIRDYEMTVVLPSWRKEQ